METLDHKTDPTKLWRTINAIDGKSTPKAENEEVKCSGWVHAKCSGILNAAQYRRKSDWTCDACSPPQSQQSPPLTRSPAPPTEQISDDSTFNVLQLNANGIGNKLTPRGSVER